MVSQDCAALGAGALGGYMWKNREVNQSSETLVSIAGIAAFSLAMGWSNETTVDNLGDFACLISSSEAGNAHQHDCLKQLQCYIPPRA